MKKSDMRLLFAFNEKLVKLFDLIEASTDPKEKDSLEKQYQFLLEESCRIAEFDGIETIFTQPRLEVGLDEMDNPL